MFQISQISQDVIKIQILPGYKIIRSTPEQKAIGGSEVFAVSGKGISFSVGSVVECLGISSNSNRMIKSIKENDDGFLVECVDHDSEFVKSWYQAFKY